MLVILIILIIIVIIIFNENYKLKRTKEKFIVLLNDKIMPDNENCYDYIYTINNNFYLVNSKTKKMIEFNNKTELDKHLKNIEKCPVDIPLIDLNVNKSNNDPTINYERQCNKNIAMANYLLDTYNFTINDENTSIDNLNDNGLDIINTTKIPQYLVKYNNDLEIIMKNNKLNDNLIASNNVNRIKNELNKFMDNAEPHELIAFNRNSCIVNELAKDADDFNELIKIVN